MVAFMAGEPVAEEAGGLIERPVRGNGDEGDPLPVLGRHAFEDGEQVAPACRERLERRPERPVVVAALALPLPRAQALPGRPVLADDAGDVGAEYVLCSAKMREQLVRRPFARFGSCQD